METIGVKELRDRLSRVLREVEKGRGVRIVRHGVPIAELQPVPRDRAQAVQRRLRDAGLLGGGSGRIGRCGRLPEGERAKSVSDLVLEERR
jgi:prevent-host-death family protein